MATWKKQSDRLIQDAFRQGARKTPGRLFLRLKRSMDIAAGGLGLLVCGPVIVAASLWIKLADGGPVLYRQWRVGYDGWMFRLYKLRTMRLDAEHDGQARFASRNDPRIIPGCGWMRKSHVDELPQLWNILWGQMSLVGPRPERPEMFEQLRPSIPKIERRLTSKPGLTGLAQVSNGYTNDLTGARRKLSYDLRYLRHRTIRGDLRLVAATIPKVWDRTAA
jgi:lipopolysaccharide/colanic/teichoic acid biosynthesis glycosyltransferase